MREANTVRLPQGTTSKLTILLVLPNGDLKDITRDPGLRGRTPKRSAQGNRSADPRFWGPRLFSSKRRMPLGPAPVVMFGIGVEGKSRRPQGEGTPR